MPESTKEDAGAAQKREGRVVGGSRVGRESSCDDNSRNANGSYSSDSTSSDSGVSGSVIDVDASGGSSGGVAGGGLSCRGGSLRLIIRGLVEGSTSSSNSRVAARVHPNWATGARGVGPSAPSGRGGCPAADDVPGRNVAVGATTRNRLPMGANLTKQSRVSFLLGGRPARTAFQTRFSSTRAPRYAIYRRKPMGLSREWRFFKTT